MLQWVIAQKGMEEGKQILRAISERGGIIGSIVSSLLGFGWTVATFLTVPVLAIENVSPIDAVKRSAQLLKRTWGEQLVGNAGVNAVFGLMMFGVFLVGVPLIVLAAISESLVLMGIAVLLVVLAALALGVISSTQIRFSTKRRATLDVPRSAASCGVGSAYIFAV